MSEGLIIELGIWLLACAVADKIKSDYIFRACDLYLIYILSGHSWRITLPVFIVLFSLMKVWMFIGDFLLDILFPELRQKIRNKL